MIHTTRGSRALCALACSALASAAIVVAGALFGDAVNWVLELVSDVRIVIGWAIQTCALSIVVFAYLCGPDQAGNSQCR